MSAAPADRTELIGSREPIDVRLAVGAVAAWLAVYLSVDSSAPGVVFGAALGLAVFGVLLLWVSTRLVRRQVLVRAGALAALCVALVLVPLAGRLGHARASPLHALAQRHAAVTLDVTVTADPRLLAAKGPAGAPRVAVETSAEAVSTGRGGSVPADGVVLVLGDAGPWRDVLPGQRVRLSGSLNPDLGGGLLSVTVFERGPPRLLGTPPWWQRAAGEVRTSLRQAATVLPDQERGLLPGLVDGDTANLDPVLAEHFRDAGLTHLVAVSGARAT